MYPPERQRAITDFLVGAGGRLAVSEIAERLDVTGETVRRDLDVLERRGVIRRVRGGAELMRSVPFEQALAARHADQQGDKEEIARRVLPELHQASVIALDSGSMTYVIARAFHPSRPVTVVTNNLPAAQLLADRAHVTLVTLPGSVRGLTQAVVDSWATRRMEEITADLSVLGVNGLSPEQGLTTTNPEEAAVKSAILRAGRRRVLPVISGKVGRSSFCRYAEVKDLDLIVTDTGADHHLLDQLSEAGPEILVA